MNEKWFAIGIDQIEKKLKTNAASGLSRKAARSAWYRYAPKAQTLFLRRSKGVGKMVGDIFADFALIMLLLAAVLALMFAEHSMGITVLAITLVSLVISFIYYYRSQKTMEQMNLYFLPTAKVIRGGKLYRVAFENVVPGDVIIIEKGDIVCADARIVTSDNLSVAMRVGRSKYIPLKKQANGVIAEKENDPKKMLNILHAGSVIEGGSARAIVFATGRYTYLGALTGGIPEFYSDNTPRELKKMRKICSHISMISMLCILPFSVVSLLISHMSGGNATLSASFLTALAICSSSMTQFACTVCKMFFVKEIKSLINEKNPVAVRTTDAFDKLLDIKYLFMLDGSAVTDGILHFDTALTAEGEIKSFDNYNATASVLFEMATLYNLAESNSLTVGIHIPDRFKIGLSEFLEKGNTDAEALKIRCPIRSYAPGTAADPVDRVFYSDTSRKMVLSVAHTDDILSECTYAIISGRVQPINTVGIDRIKHAHNIHVSQGKKVLIFTVSSFENCDKKTGKCIVGAVVLREGTDKSAASSITTLEKKGIRVISFVGSHADGIAPEIPLEAQCGAKAYKDDFIRVNYPITYKFGEIGTYYGLNKDDISTLLAFAHQRHELVAVIGFSDYAPEVIEKADVFISCAPIINIRSAKNEEELYTLEVAGEGTSLSCIQTVKSEADMIIQRPSGRKGGIQSLIKAFSNVLISHKNLWNFFRYSLCAQFVRILMAALPMAFGNTNLDARHVILCSFIIDILALILFASDKSFVAATSRSKYRISSLKKQIVTNKYLLVTALTASLVAIFLPVIVDFIGIFGPYLYKVEYLMCAMLWLHIAILYFVKFETLSNIKDTISNKLFLSIVIGIIIFVVLTLLIPPLGLLFEIESNPFAYMLLSFVPTIVFIVMAEILVKLKGKI